MDYNSYNIDKVMEYWNDISQDIDFISSELKLDKKTIINILKKLQKEGKVEYETIEESINPDIKNSLNLKHFSNNYTFKNKKINKLYDSIIFDIYVKSVESFIDNIIFDCELTFKNKTYSFIISYDSDENVYYASLDGKDSIKKLLSIMNDNLERLHQSTMKIINDNIPTDYWEGKVKQN